MPDPIGEIIERRAPAQRPQRGPDARAAGRVLHHLREPAQRDGRCRGAVRQERQRLHPARRQGGAALQPGAVRAWCRRRGRGRPARPTPCSWSQTTDRAAVGHLLAMPESIDVVIPRGGEGLIARVSAEAKMPVIKHFDGNCHVYVDAAGRPRAGRAGHRQRQDPEVERLQRGRIAAGASRRWRRLPAAHRRGLRRQGRRDARRRAAPGAAGRRARRSGDADRGRLGRGVPRPDHLRQGGRLAGRGHRAHQPLRLAAHRRDRDHATTRRDALPARGRLGR